MSKITILSGDAEKATRVRRFVCPFCDTVFSADSENYTLATYKEQADYGVTAFSECPVCENNAVSPVGSAGEIQTPVALVILTMPTTTAYRPGETFSSTGLVLGLRFTDGSIGTVALDGCTFSPDEETALTLSDTEVTVTHTETGLAVDVPIAVRNQVIPEVQLVSDDFVYNGSSQSPVIRYYDSATSTRGGTPSATAAGAHTVTYTPKTGYCWPDGSTSALSIVWHIAKAPNTIVAPTVVPLVYTGAAQNLVQAGSAKYGTMKYKTGSASYSTSIPKKTNAGDYDVYWKVDGGNYEDYPETKITATIAKAVPKVTAPEAYTDMRYTNHDQPLCKSGATSVGTMEYRVSSDGVLPVVWSEWAETVPTGKAAGRYNVEYRVLGGTNYEDVYGNLAGIKIATTAPAVSVSTREVNTTAAAQATSVTAYQYPANTGYFDAGSSDPTVCTVSHQTGASTISITPTGEGTATVTVRLLSGEQTPVVRATTTIAVTVTAS